MNFNFSEILTRAWQIVWKHRVLWVFGILASCSRGGSNFNSNSSGQGSGGTPSNVPPQLLPWVQTIQENITTFIVIGVTVFCLILIVTIFLGTIGRIGLIRGTFQADGGAESLVLGQLFSESTPYFWRVFGLSLISSIPFVVVVAAILAAATAYLILIPVSAGSDTQPAFGLALIPLVFGCLCLLIPLVILINLIVRQAENAIVLEEMSIMPAVSRGWDVFRNNLGPIIIMGIILTVISFAVGFVIAIPILIVVVPAAIAFAAGQAENWTPLALAGICICLYIPISLLINGIAIAYTESAWTLTYMRLTRPPVNEPAQLPDTNV